MITGHTVNWALNSKPEFKSLLGQFLCVSPGTSHFACLRLTFPISKTNA